MRDRCPRTPDQQHSQRGMRQKPGTSGQRQQGGPGHPKYTSKRPSHLSPEGGCPSYLLPLTAAKESPWPAPICHGRMAQRDPLFWPRGSRGATPRQGAQRSCFGTAGQGGARPSAPLGSEEPRRGPGISHKFLTISSDDSPLAPGHRDVRWRAPHSFPPPHCSIPSI